jgi:hypothetical protein
MKCKPVHQVWVASMRAYLKSQQRILPANWLPAHAGGVDVEQGRDFLGRKVDVEVAIEPLLVAGQSWVAGLQLLKKARVHLLEMHLKPAPVFVEVKVGLSQPFCRHLSRFAR